MLLQAKEGVPPDQQRLLNINGRQLEDECTLAECNVRHKDTLHMVLRLRCAASQAVLPRSPPRSHSSQIHRAPMLAAQGVLRLWRYLAVRKQRWPQQALPLVLQAALEATDSRLKTVHVPNVL